MFHRAPSARDGSVGERAVASPRPTIRLFCADLDGTLLGVPQGTERFVAAWRKSPAGQRPFLLYNTGRCVRDVRCLINLGVLPEPDGIVGDVGTELWLRDNPALVAEFQARFSRGWNPQTVEMIVNGIPGVTRQPASAFTRHKLSWFWDYASDVQIKWLRQRLEEVGLQVKVVYSSQRYLDVVPAAGDKGQALNWLCERLNVVLREVLVAGDTANDSSMMLLPEVHRLVVGNALPELLADLVAVEKYCSRGLAADGVLDGLRAYGVLRGAAVTSSADAVGTSC
jgi:sucrose-6F-phosphate phosphohydrolase